MGEFVRIMWSPISSRLFIPPSSSPAAWSRTFPLLSRFLFYMIEDTFISFCALFYVIEDVLFFCFTFYFTSKTSKTVVVCVHVCIRAVEYCLLVSCFFFLFSGRGYTNSRELSLHKRNDPWKIDSPLITTPYHILSLLPCTLSFTFSFCRFIGRIPSMFLPSLAHRSSGFNFVHFCFLNYFFVSSIRWRQSYFRKILYFRLLFHKSAKL